MDIRIRDNVTAAEYLAQVKLLDKLQVTDDGLVVEKHVCSRCGGRGIYSEYHGVCYECNAMPSRMKWTTHTSIVSFARKVKSENATRARRQTASQKNRERTLEKQRDWCEENGYGRITFEEKRAAQQERWAREQEARAAKSRHVGTPKQREEFTVKVERVIGLGHNDYGDFSELVKLTTVEGGYSMVWITGSRPTEVRAGAVLVLTATVKEHSEYQGEKQTKVTRAKVVRVIDPGQEQEES